MIRLRFPRKIGEDSNLKYSFIKPISVMLIGFFI